MDSIMENFLVDITGTTCYIALIQGDICMFIVMRTHSPSTDKRGGLWQVVSRPFGSHQAAQNWCEFMQKEYQEDHPRGSHKFFVIETLGPNNGE